MWKKVDAIKRKMDHRNKYDEDGFLFYQNSSRSFN